MEVAFSSSSIASKDEVVDEPVDKACEVLWFGQVQLGERLEQLVVDRRHEERGVELGDRRPELRIGAWREVWAQAIEQIFEKAVPCRHAFAAAATFDEEVEVPLREAWVCDDAGGLFEEESSQCGAQVTGLTEVVVELADRLRGPFSEGSFEHDLEQPVLGAEVVVDGGDVDAGLLGDHPDCEVAHAHPLDARDRG
jgi:hypothetical protein